MVLRHAADRLDHVGGGAAAGVERLADDRGLVHPLAELGVIPTEVAGAAEFVPRGGAVVDVLALVVAEVIPVVGASHGGTTGPRRAGQQPGVTADDHVAVAVTLVQGALVFVVAAEGVIAEPARPVFFLREVELVDELALIFVAHRVALGTARLERVEVGAQEVGIGPAVEELFAHVHVNEHGRFAAGADERAREPARLLAAEAELGGEHVAGRVYEELLELHLVAVGLVRAPVGSGEVDFRPVVNRAVGDADGGRRERTDARRRRGLDEPLVAIRGMEVRRGNAGGVDATDVAGHPEIDRAAIDEDDRAGEIGAGRRHAVAEQRVLGADARGIGHDGLHAVARERPRRGIPRRAAAGLPEAEAVAREDGVGAARIVVVALERGAQRRGLERPVGDHAGVAIGPAERRLADIFVGLVDDHAADGEFVAEERPVEVEHGAEAAEIVGAERQAGHLALEVGRRGDGVDRAGAAAEAPDIGVRAAADFHAVDHRRVDGEAGLEVAERLVGGADAADAVGVVGIAGDVVLRGAVAIDEDVGVGAGALGAGLVEEHVVDIEHREVLHLLLGDDGDGGAEVLELGVDARAGKRVGGEVALVGRAADLERRHLDDFVRFRRGGGRVARDGLREHRRDGQPRAGEDHEEKPRGDDGATG
jgi:hypothetical protein